jgi:phosphoesterase RecJ-like protein
MLGNNIYKQIFKKIKDFDSIVIARHVGADPDAIGSSVGLKEIIKNTFPEKEVYVVGYPAKKFRFMGELDKLPEYIGDSLLIVTDTPNKSRVDGAKVEKFKEVIKIDHHPFIEDFGGVELIDDTACSASQMVIELTNKTALEMTKSAAEKLYIGIVADTNRFMFYYTSPKTFRLVAGLIEETGIDIASLYEPLYLKPLKNKQFQAYIVSNLTLTENGFGYLLITEKALKEHDIDAATARNMINEFNYTEELLAWALFTKDKNTGNLKGSIRSRGPIVNKVASHYNGGGHIYASGVRMSEDKLPALVKELDQTCIEFKGII